MLAEFNFKVAYKKGADNHHADALSGLLSGSPTIHENSDEIPTFALDEEDAKREHDVENDFSEVEYESVDELLALQELSLIHI